MKSIDMANSCLPGRHAVDDEIYACPALFLKDGPSLIPYSWMEKRGLLGAKQEKQIVILERICYIWYEAIGIVLMIMKNDIRKWMKGEITMKRYVCEVCGYVYDETEGDPDNGVAAGTKWEDVPEDWVCPLCGVGKDQFAEE